MKHTLRKQEFSQYYPISHLAETDEPRIAGIVPWAPLEMGTAVRPAIEALSADRKVKGIRRIIQFESDLGFCLRSDFIQGVRMLAEYGLTFDICIDYRHLDNTIRFVDHCPDVHFILDHIGKPDIRNHRLDSCRSVLRYLRDCLLTARKLICVKYSMTTPRNFIGWPDPRLNQTG